MNTTRYLSEISFFRVVTYNIFSLYKIAPILIGMSKLYGLFNFNLLFFVFHSKAPLCASQFEIFKIQFYHSSCFYYKKGKGFIIISGKHGSKQSYYGILRS